MDITLAILNFNRSKFLDRSLRSCLDQVLSNNLRDDILKNSPKDNKDYFVVPKVVE